MKSPKILVYVNSYLPGYKSGGPVRSIAALTKGLNGRFDFYIITRDRDAGDLEPYASVKQNAWNKLDNSFVCYISSNLKGIVYGLIPIYQKKYDLVYLNSLFNFRYSILPLFLSMFTNKPIILAPRGELSQGALSIGSSKKNFFLRVFKLFKIHRRIYFHATSREEEYEVKSHFGSSVKFFTVPNLSLTRDVAAKKSPPRNKMGMRIVFVSRISKKKNLHTAISALSLVKSNVIFDVYGPASRDDDRLYLEYCMSIAAELPKNIKVNFKGPVDNKYIVNLLADYDMFFLPTLGENYGHVIVEALAAGLPLLISNKTPWNSIEECGAGWIFEPMDTIGFSQCIERLTRLTIEQYDDYRRCARDFYLNIISSKEADNIASAGKMFDAVIKREED